jgi:hypothetical protein
MLLGQLTTFACVSYPFFQNLVDLAGSERLSHTLATGVRMVEGCKINQSLSNLGTVISKLAEGERYTLVPCI